MPQLVIITDPGPDPDDVKALLVAAIAHGQRRLRLRAVICNGGGDPLGRARLARCVLDHVGASSVPVGVGSMGVSRDPRPYEYAIEGYSSVDDSRLEPGHELLQSVLRSVGRKSLRVVLISSLRDFADVVAAVPNLVDRKVHSVAVMGGLRRTENPPAAKGAGDAAHARASRASQWEPDTSQNNEFDRAAANQVYAFCLDHEVRLIVVGRDAVPRIPMQLARSFARRTACPIMRYLEHAQFEGLVGLWQKLCAGELPQRCTKQWYFETFCGVGAATFAERGHDAMGPGDDIINFLDGCAPLCSCRHGAGEVGSGPVGRETTCGDACARNVYAMPC